MNFLLKRISKTLLFPTNGLRHCGIALVAFSFFSSNLFSQSTPSTPPADTAGKKEVEILNADYLKFQEEGGKKYSKLVGNVQLKQEGVLMWCDSANLDKDNNTVDAWGHVHIRQDTVDAYSQTLHHDGNSKLAVLNGDARLNDGKMKLFTEQLFYDVRNKLGYYLVGGRVLKDSTVIVSRKAYYYSRLNDAYFNDSVVITDPNYNLVSDTLKYNTDTKISVFYGNTTIYNKNSTIFCDNGWYDSKRDISSFGKNTVVHNPPQCLFTDSLYYERFRGFGKVIGCFQWVDSSNETEIFGRYGEYYDTRQSIMATERPFLIHKMDKDSLFLAADTLKSMQKSLTDTVRTFFAYHHVKLFMKDMQGVCDSLYYSFADSTFRMFYKPVIWNENTQISGDTIYLFTKNNKANRFSIYRAGFIISPSGPKYYDQIKGVNIFGYFENDELHKMDVVSNAESLYFGKDEKDKYIGNNKAQSQRIVLYFKDKKIEKIVFIKKPEAVFTPMKMLKKEQYYLKDFNWQIDRRPKSREELMD